MCPLLLLADADNSQTALFRVCTVPLFSSHRCRTVLGCQARTIMQLLSLRNWWLLHSASRGGAKHGGQKGASPSPWGAGWGGADGGWWAAAGLGMLGVVAQWRLTPNSTKSGRTAPVWRRPCCAPCCARCAPRWTAANAPAQPQRRVSRCLPADAFESSSSQCFPGTATKQQSRQRTQLLQRILLAAPLPVFYCQGVAVLVYVGGGELHLIWR